MKADSHTLHGITIVSTLAACLVILSGTARAQLLYSYETGLENWSAATSTLAISTTLGVTDGLQSMVIDNHGPNFNNDAGVVTHGAGSGNAFNSWDDAAIAIGEGQTDVKLEFDFSWDHSAVSAHAWAQLGIFVNSTGAGFRQYGTGGLIGGNTGGTLDLFPRLETAAIADGVTLTSLGPNTVHIAIPIGPFTLPSGDVQGLNIGGGAPGTNFYQMGFKTNGGWTGTVDWAIDNMRLTGVQVPTTEETLFSWETPDDTNTPGVDERFEGWLPGDFENHTPHGHAIVTTGATDGTHALEIDRTDLETGFTWGSLFELDSTINPGDQARIEELIGKVEAADRVAFDVTYEYVDRFPIPNPTFTEFGVHFSDVAGKFYQAFGDSINVAGADDPTTSTIEIPLEDFVDANNSMFTLKTTGLQDDSTFFRIGISTSTDGAQIYQIDNFRLITEVSEGVPGDYNGNGKVDAADYVLWRKGGPLQNEVHNPGTVSAEDYTEWRARFGNPGSGAGLAGGNAAVPEPATVSLIVTALAAAFSLSGRYPSRRLR